jgi:hypothetical protein
VMAQCCTGGGPSRRFARRVSGAVASMLPGAVLVLLPKCPLCLAASIAVATGIGVSAEAAAWVRWLIAVFWVVALALATVKIFGGRRSWVSLRRSGLQHHSGSGRGYI